MYTCGYDKEAGLLVSLMSGTGSSDAEWLQYLADGKRAHADAVGRQDGLVLVVVADPEFERPDPAQRKLIVEGLKELQSTKSYFALVTSSALVRGVLTAMGWVVSVPNQEVFATASFDEAKTWAERRRGKPLPLLQTLLDQARAQTLKR